VTTYGDGTYAENGSDAAGVALDALGDPTRRRILELLQGGERAVGELAGDLPVTRPAVSQHLRVLEGAGLVTARREGTRHLYAVDATGLAGLRDYLEAFWDSALAAFAAAAQRQGGER
jgi:DNA-binding transcriptional ArsR family regulator